jgi:hypothetical protein
VTEGNNPGPVSSFSINSGLPAAQEDWPDGIEESLERFSQGDLVPSPPLFYFADPSAPVWARTARYSETSDGPNAAANAAFIAAARNLVPALLDEVERLHSWEGLMSLLDEMYPDDIYPTREDDETRDPGPRIVSLLRRLDEARASVEFLSPFVEANDGLGQALVEARAEVERLNRHLAVVEERRRESLRLTMAERDEARAAIARVEALHREDYENGPLGICRECYGEDHPCATIRAVRGES